MSAPEYTPSEFKAVREDMGLSVRDLAFVLGTEERTVRKWEIDGGLGPNPVACRALRWLYVEGFQPPELAFIR